MKAAVIVFPGSNCDRDMAVGLRAAGAQVTMVWHKDTDLPTGTDVVAVPGGFPLATTCAAAQLPRSRLYRALCMRMLNVVDSSSACAMDSKF